MNSWRWSHSDTHSSTFPLSTRPARARAGQLRTRLGAPVLPKVLTAQLWVPLLFPALRLNTREHSPACTWLHALCRECQSGWAPVIGTGSLGPISPQRGHYHVIWSRGDTVCMESLGRLQGGADPTPRAPHPHPCLKTTDNSWQLLRRSTRATEQRAGRVFCVPCGRTQVYSESHNGEGHSQYTRAPFTVSCWPFSFMV